MAKTNSGPNATGSKRAEVASRCRRRRYGRTLGEGTLAIRTSAADSRQSASGRVYKRVDWHDQDRRLILESDSYRSIRNFPNTIAIERSQSLSSILPNRSNHGSEHSRSPSRVLDRLPLSRLHIPPPNIRNSHKRQLRTDRRSNGHRQACVMYNRQLELI